MNNKKIVLAIMDGIGLRNEKFGNAVKLANPKFLNYAMKKFPNTQLHASGEYVGLPYGQIGNSEVGHQNIGAGRTVLQELLTINESINNGKFFKNKVLLDLIQSAKDKKKSLHIIGLISNGGVHGSIEHIVAILKFAKHNNFKNIFIHAITDGRDTLPNVSNEFLKQLYDNIRILKVGKIVTVVGRYFAMDRDSNFDRTKTAYDAIVLGQGQKVENLLDAVNEKISNGETDEFIKPIILEEYKGFKKGDFCLFTNFRADRARQLCYAIADKDFNEFIINNTFNLTTMTSYGEKLDKLQVKYLFSQKVIKNNLTEVVTKSGGKVLKIAETTKYAHVTYFFNGLKEKPYKNEDRILIKSDNVETFDLKPQMKADEIANSAIEAIKKEEYNLIVLNLANGDMVGHSGNLKATKVAVKAVDKALKKIYNNLNDYTLIITADHGNAELILDKQKNKITSHTTNPVPFIICDKKARLKQGDFALSNIAPTILHILEIEKPSDMTSESILVD